jgi:hypothetical protein
VGQVMDTESINATPLNGRNWVYIAQLTAGVDPGLAAGGARGGGTGDFSANGQRTTQNNFILDGVDNNVNVDDFQNGASYNVRPPPDALAEFKIDTSNYSAEFGHSAGAVLNASIKSGTNQIHGDAWEYVRNTKFDAADWDLCRRRQFPPTTRTSSAPRSAFPSGRTSSSTSVMPRQIASPMPNSDCSFDTVPTASQRNGDFSEYFLTRPKLARAHPLESLRRIARSGCLDPGNRGAVTNPDPNVRYLFDDLRLGDTATPGSGIGPGTTNNYGGDRQCHHSVNLTPPESPARWQIPSGRKSCKITRCPIPVVGHPELASDAPGSGLLYNNYSSMIPSTTIPGSGISAWTGT